MHPARRPVPLGELEALVRVGRRDDDIVGVVLSGFVVCSVAEGVDGFRDEGEALGAGGLVLRVGGGEGEGGVGEDWEDC